MKKILCLLCSLLFLCGAVACGNGNSEQSPSSEPNSGEDVEQTYTIELDVGVVSNSNYSLSVTSITVKYGDTIELPTPSCAGYTFKYWSLRSQEFTDTVFTLDKDIVLVAEWKEVSWPDNF